MHLGLVVDARISAHGVKADGRRQPAPVRVDGVETHPGTETREPAPFPVDALRRERGGDVWQGHDVLTAARSVVAATLAPVEHAAVPDHASARQDRKSTRLNSSHVAISYAV